MYIINIDYFWYHVTTTSLFFQHLATFVLFPFCFFNSLTSFEKSLSFHIVLIFHRNDPINTLKFYWKMKGDCTIPTKIIHIMLGVNPNEWRSSDRPCATLPHLFYFLAFFVTFHSIIDGIESLLEQRKLLLHSYSS